MSFVNLNSKSKKRKTVSKPTTEIRFKMLGVFAFLLVSMLYIACVLVNLQVVEHEDWEKKAVGQFLSDTIISPRRGTIYDKNMVALAQNADVWMLTVDPYGFRKDPRDKSIAKKNWPLDETKVTAFGNKLEEVLGVSIEDFRKRCLRNSQYEIIKDSVEKPERDLLVEFINEIGNAEKDEYGNVIRESITIKGVNFTKTSKRYYAYDSLASSVIGFVNKNGVGAAGLESKYESTLKGVPGRIVVARNASKQELTYRYEKTIDEKQGSDLVLTIDTSIQKKLENRLKTATAENVVKQKGAGIVMDVETGEILAMATIPDYNLNDPYTIVDEKLREQIDSMPIEGDPVIITDKNGKEEEVTPLKLKEEAKTVAQQEQWKNKAITDTYHPGSVFKPVTCAMALEEGQTNVNAGFHCTGHITVGGRTIGCHKTSGHGSQTLVDGMKNSCNPVFFGLGLGVGTSSFSRYFDAFGLTKKTGIDLPGEQIGVSYKEEDMKQIDLAMASIGQSFTITPIQMITAMCAVANGGYLVEPHVVSRVVDGDGNIVDAKTTNIKRQVISKETSDTLRMMLEKVVDDGTGRNGYLEGYRIAGKTGTSEKLKESLESGQKKYIASFCGFAPADNPKVAVLIILDEPEGTSHMGGAIAAPVVKGIMSDILPLLGVEPVYSGDDQINKTVETPIFLDTSSEDASKTAANNGLKVKVVGDKGTIVRQVPSPGSRISSGGTVIVYTNAQTSAEATVPNFKGMTPGEANIAAAGAHVNINFSGKSLDEAGVRVGSQSIAAGTKVDEWTIVNVDFIHTQNVE